MPLLRGIPFIITFKVSTHIHAIFIMFFSFFFFFFFFSLCCVFEKKFNCLKGIKQIIYMRLLVSSSNPYSFFEFALLSPFILAC